jgi:hypothetical protein
MTSYQLYIDKCQDMLDNLKKITDAGPTQEADGICGNLGPSVSWLLSQKMFKAWPKYSGSTLFPVPAPKVRKNALAASKIYRNGYVDKWEGPYGKLRWELVSFCIKELEEVLMNDRKASLVENAIPYLWDGKNIHDQATKSGCVCFSLCYDTDNDAFYSVTRDIRKSLGDHLMITDWLVAQGIPEADLTKEAVQTYRIAWMKQMVEDYRKKAQKYNVQ